MKKYQVKRIAITHRERTPRFVRFLQPVIITAAAATLMLALPLRTSASPPPFSITPLALPSGSSEPEISIGNDGTMGMLSLQWLFEPNFGTALWTGPFGSTPTFEGAVDAALQQPGKTIFGGNDADIDIGLTGRFHVTTLILLVNPPFLRGQLGVSAITCPSPAVGSFSISQCTVQIIDTTRDDRSWITSEGAHVYISYRDSGNLSLIHMQRSDDDGFTWKRVGDPIVGQAGLTADAIPDDVPGNIVADPRTHNVYDIYVAGQSGLLKHSFTLNQIVVSRSTDMGKSWTPNVAFTAPVGTRLINIFPAIAVDPVNGNLYAVWSDGQTVSFSSSTDQGNTWRTPIAVSHSPATTAVLPWVAAYNGTVDVVYYGTSATSNLDPSASWYVYFAQFNGTGFTQTQVNLAANHVGVICTGGIGCGPGTRNLLDLFKVAINPQNGKAAIIYADDTLTTSNDPNNVACSPGQSPPCKLPQAVLAQQN